MTVNYVIINFRGDAKLHEDFSTACKINGTDVSKQLRHFEKEYVKENKSKIKTHNEEQTKRAYEYNGESI